LSVLVSPGAQGAGNTCTNDAPVGTPITVSFNNNNSKCPNGWYLERPDGCATQSGVNNWYVTATCVNGGTQVKIHTSCSCEIGLCSTFNGYTIFGYQLPADPNSNDNPWRDICQWQVSFSLLSIVTDCTSNMFCILQADLDKFRFAAAPCLQPQAQLL